MATNVDLVADFQSAKRKVEKYHTTMKRIPTDGVLLGEILNVPVYESESNENVLNLVESLSKLAQPRSFCCGGWIELNTFDKRANLKMLEDKTVQYGWPICDLPVDKLLKHCTPAQYGDLARQATVYDPNVRLAHECPGSKFEFMHIPKDSGYVNIQRWTSSRVPMFLEVIRKRILETLVVTGKDITLQRYKLNVYGKGGFFSAHVDTPVDAALMIGTVVVCLPSKHTGGVLKVQHKGIKEEFKFAHLSGDAEKIQWAAFYSDCTHEILPVEDGHRVTITFNIIQKRPVSIGFSGCKSENCFAGPVVQEDKAEILDSIISDAAKIATDVAQDEGVEMSKLGIFLRHKYTMSALAEAILKGCDQTLYDGLTSKGIICRLQTVLVHEIEVNLETDDVEESKEEREQYDVFSFSQEDMAFVNKQGPKPEHALWGKMKFIREWSKEKIMINEEDRGRENYGNYTEPGETERLYLQSVVIMDIPAKKPPKDKAKECTGCADDDKPATSNKSTK
ncbi:uncharacterized protein LOC117307226 [Asterias rubens]|uniref:uncharacterized protein LOC117307226 n=1 Tax=Asterias rubens TaxID=7604 RepID=UPI0014555CE7|nr:uncharacterized protein LOC117307226 [Asterias rubens]